MRFPYRSHNLTAMLFWLSIAAVAVTVAFLLTHIAVPLYFHFILSFASL